MNKTSQYTPIIRYFGVKDSRTPAHSNTVVHVTVVYRGFIVHLHLLINMLLNHNIQS